MFSTSQIEHSSNISHFSVVSTPLFNSIHTDVFTKSHSNNRHISFQTLLTPLLYIRIFSTLYFRPRSHPTVANGATSVSSTKMLRHGPPPVGQCLPLSCRSAIRVHCNGSPSSFALPLSVRFLKPSLQLRNQIVGPCHAMATVRVPVS